MEDSKETIKYLLEDFDSLMEQKADSGDEVTNDEIEHLASKIDCRETLREALPELLQKASDYKDKIDNSDRNIKNWQDNKKFWKKRQDAFMDVLEKIVQRLRLPGNSIKDGSIKLAVSSRTAIEVDEDWLLGRYEALRQALQSQLPDFVKVSYTLDKNKLSAFLKTDTSLLTDHPEKIHTRTTTSCTLKG